jgi:hypothetical protein
MIGTIEIKHEGTAREVIYVRHESARYDEPVRDVIWWRVRRVQRNPYRPAWPKSGDRVESSGHDDWHGPGYSVWFPGYQTGRTAVEPIPRPKVRAGIETRYRYGRWEKLLKKGWVPA